ncbi:MAG: outer membrane beta-barrel protein [Saprospiraceae bacterium]
MKNLLLLLALAFFASPLFSQEKKEDAPTGKPKERFSLGILGGLNMNQMPSRPNVDLEGGSYNTRLVPDYAFFAGISARQPILKRLAAKMDVQFAARGFGCKKVASTFPAQEGYRASYLDFVPQVEYNVFKNIYLSLGGYGGVLIEERLKYSNQDWARIDPDFITLAEDTDWGLASGLRVEFGRVSALVKYQHGLTPAIKLETVDSTGALSSPLNQYHRSLQIGVGFKIL